MKKEKRAYKIVFTHFYELFGLTPTEMIAEAEKQQEPDWKKKRFLHMKERNVTKYLEKYQNYLEKTRKNKDSTIRNNLNIIRSFYEQFNIKLPKADIITIPRTRTRRTDIPTWDDVEEVVEVLDNKKYIALVYFFATSGIRSGDVCALTIGDFLEATKKYHNGTLEDLLSKDPYEYSIQPAWDFDPEKTNSYGNVCLTSNTPQAVKALFDYLKKRIKDGYPVDNETALFRSSSKRKKGNGKSFFYHARSLSDLFKRTINPIFNTKDEEGNTVERLDKFGYVFFRPHNLRKLFKTTCGANLPKVMLEVEEKGTLMKNIDILGLLTGHEPMNPQITQTYEAVDHEDIEPYYFHMIPYLTIGEIKAKDAHSDEFKELKEEISKRDERIDKLEAKEKKQEKLNYVLENLDDDKLDMAVDIIKKGKKIE